jgi:hypothetical protein
MAAAAPSIKAKAPRNPEGSQPLTARHRAWTVFHPLPECLFTLSRQIASTEFRDDPNLNMTTEYLPNDDYEKSLWEKPKAYSTRMKGMKGITAGIP